MNNEVIEARVTAYATPCLTCQALATAGEKIVDGKAIMRSGVAHAIGADGLALCDARFPSTGAVA